LNEDRSLFFPRPYASISFGGVGGAPNINVGNFVIPARQEFESQCTVNDQRATPASNWNATGLPAGLTISSTGLISGTPTEVGTFNPTISALGGDGSSASVVFTFRVVGGLAIILPNQTITGKVDVPLSASLSLDMNSAPPVYFKAVDLPSYMVIEDDGAIVGTPTKTGTFSLQVTVYSVFGSATETVNFVISSGVPQIEPNQNALAYIGFALSYYPELINETSSPATSWSATGLPSGANINSTTGEITWTPTTEQVVSLQVTAISSSGQTTAPMQITAKKCGYRYHGNLGLILTTHSRHTTDSGLSVVSAEYSCPLPKLEQSSRLLKAKMALPNFTDHISRESATQSTDASGFCKFSIVGYKGKKYKSVPVNVPTIYGSQLSSVTMTLNKRSGTPLIYQLKLLSDTITKKFTIDEGTSMTEIGLPVEAIKFQTYEITDTVTSVSWKSFAEFLASFKETYTPTPAGYTPVGTNRAYSIVIPSPETALSSVAQLVSLTRSNYGDVDEVTATWGLAFTNFSVALTSRTEFIPF
jgi:hypothetical protein